MAEHPRYILTLSCRDVRGIVAAVAGFLTEKGGFILESAQYGDPDTRRFFMRTVFTLEASDARYDELSHAFGEQVARLFGMEWHLQDCSQKQRIFLMVSKQGHCLNDLLHRYSTGLLPCEVVGVGSNHRDMEETVRWHRLPFFHIPITPETKVKAENTLWNLLEEQQVDMLVLARYMQVLSPELTRKLRGRAINIHHSFLPSFKGAKPYHQAHERGVKLIGATAHYINDALDEGPIIEQEVTRVDHTQTAEQLRVMGQDIESVVLSRAVVYHLERRVLLNGNKTVVFR